MSTRLPAKQPSGLTRSGRVRPGLMFRVPLSDGSQALGFVRATNVLFGGMAVLLFEDSSDGATDAGSRMEIEQDRVLAFLLTWPDPVRDGVWPLVPREVLPLSSREWAMLGGFDADRIRNPVVHPVSRVQAFLEAARGLRDWDEAHRRGGPAGRSAAGGAWSASSITPEVPACDAAREWKFLSTGLNSRDLRRGEARVPADDRRSEARRLLPAAAVGWFAGAVRVRVRSGRRPGSVWLVVSQTCC
jgi:hypothetical protein